MDKYGAIFKATSIRDTRILSQVEHLLQIYDQLIPILDNDENQFVKDISIDLMDNLQNIRRLYDVANSVLVANILDGTEKGEKFTKVMYNTPIEKIFDKFGIKQSQGVE